MSGADCFGKIFRWRFPVEILEQCIIPGRIELPYAKGVQYKSFDDPMGGRGDSWAKCIAHQ